jgi:hypothetical protein
MSTRARLRRTLVFAAALLLSAAAHAQLFRAYVSASGNDANPCTLPAPCRLLPAALNAVVDGGEIWMLDSANYNTATVTIAKSVSILAVPGAVGSIVATPSSAISITANNLKVALRNVVIVPLPGSGTDGIYMNGNSVLTIESSLVANLPGNGLYVNGGGKLRIVNTTIRDTGGFAVYLNSGPAAEISGTRMLGNANGGVIANGSNPSTSTTASLSDSVISGGVDGVYAFAAAAGASSGIYVTRCTIEGTGIPLYSFTNGTGSALITVSASMITNNTYPYVQGGAGSAIKSLGNNHIVDNANAPGGSLTTVTLQ